MLTISQLAAYAGVTVRAVRHYHTKGLMPEPERDHSGYRRYGAAAVVELIRIRTLAEAGVPLSRVEELLDADPAEFAAAVRDIDDRLQQEIDDRQQHRERIAQLAAGDSLALAPEAVAYFERLRELGFRERLIEVERDSWILISASVPEQVAELMAVKRQQIEDPGVREFFRELESAVDIAPDDPRMDEVADRVVAFIEAATEAAGDVEIEQPLDQGLIDLLDTAFLESFPCAPRLLELLEERGWTGWTMIERIRR